MPTEYVTLVARRREHFRVFWSIFLVAELPPKKRCFVLQEFTRFEIIPLSILDCDQQNLGHFLSNFEWSGHRSAHVFSDGWSTAPHKRKMTLLEAPTGPLFFYYKDIKQEIVHTLLLEEYGASKK